MKSATAITYELDNAINAAKQLAESISKQLVNEKNAVGILLCDADLDGAVVTGELKKQLGMEVAGMTTLATLDRDGHHEAAAVLTVLTSDDCIFIPKASESLANRNFEQKITEACRAVSPEKGERGNTMGMLFAFCPNGMPFSGDKYPGILSQVIGDLPIMGGVASDDYDFKRARVFLSGKEYKDSLVLIGIWGNVRPVFSIRHVTSRFAERIRRITEAKDNIVYKVGNENFVQYLESFGLKTDVPDPVLAFTSYPMMLTSGDTEDEVPLMRHISGLDHTNGSGSFFGDVPVGTMANICLINKNDLVTACRDSMNALLEEANKRSDYKYSTVICISCCGRAMILGADSGAEGSVLSETLPGGLTLTGAYCLGEICPTRYKDGKAVNRFHNCSITFCIF